jgi:hypothetical protein
MQANSAIWEPFVAEARMSFPINCEEENTFPEVSTVNPKSGTLFETSHTSLEGNMISNWLLLASRIIAPAALPEIVAN